jgi:hypothetical protein
MIARVAGQSDNHTDSGRFTILHRHRSTEQREYAARHRSANAKVALACERPRQRRKGEDPLGSMEGQAILFDSQVYKKRASIRATATSRVNGG